MDIFIRTALAQGNEVVEVRTFMDMGYNVSDVVSGLSFFWMFMMWFFWVAAFALVVLGVVILVKHFRKSDEEEEIYTCPECGYEYKEQEWAAKCQRWCNEYKSCNLEINKHGSPKE